MSQDLITRYKKSIRLQFHSAETEKKYRRQQDERGRSSSSFAFIVLFLLCAVYAYLEYRAFGHEQRIPMYGYLVAAGLALANAALSWFGSSLFRHNLRLLGSGLVAMVVVVIAVYLQKYSAWHALEFVLLLVWFGSLITVQLMFSMVINILLSFAFLLAMFMSEVSGFWISLMAAVLVATVVLSLSIGYLSKRSRRLLFLQSEINSSMTRRQEMWAFTLIDLDIALSGIRDFKELILLLKKHLEQVIEFESYMLTSLEGQGPKPVADQVEGRLFEEDDRTQWSEDLLGKLTQTRQATVSAEHETVRGFLGMKRERFISYRLDVPVFSDSKMMGVISLRRESKPFDDLDKIASVSIAAQAMLIFKRTLKSAEVLREAKQRDKEHKQREQQILSSTIIQRRKKTEEDTAHTGPSDTRDLEMTDGNFGASDQTLAPADVVNRMKASEASSRKTITLMSRENADKVAIDRYRTAAVEGEPLSILIVEIDGLSKLREQDGDEVAYKVFAAIVKYIFSQVDKEKDILGRYGQNGLSVLMPKVHLNAAERFAESIRQAVANARYKTAYGERTATLSIGVAAITDDTGDYASMVKRADMALFVAKKNGRNCVKVRV